MTAQLHIVKYIHMRVLAEPYHQEYYNTHTLDIAVAWNTTFIADSTIHVLVSITMSQCTVTMYGLTVDTEYFCTYMLIYITTVEQVSANLQETMGYCIT